MHTYVPWLWTLALTFGAAASSSPRSVGQKGEASSMWTASSSKKVFGRQKVLSMA